MLTVVGHTLLSLFLALVVTVVLARRPRMLIARYGRRHRLLGVAYVCWLGIGAAHVYARYRVEATDALMSSPSTLLSPLLFYDVCLGILGSALTYSASVDFPLGGHDKASVDNVASGAMHETTTVSVKEMREHLFYQLLNIAQIVMLHTVPFLTPQWSSSSVATLLSSFSAFSSVWPSSVTSLLVLRCMACMAVTSLWLWRHRFPVNSFSRNYTGARAHVAWSEIEAILYRFKKWQYLLYKHALLHSLNVTVSVRGGIVALSSALPSSSMTTTTHIAHASYFRLYWIGLNAAYTFEFFLQTLVRRRVMSQSTMLCLNQLLMVASTLAAVQVLWHAVWWPLVPLSMTLNIVYRHHDVMNTAIVLCACVVADAIGWASA